MGVPAHFSHGMVLLDGTPKRGGTSAIYIFMAQLTLFNEALKRKSVAPQALKNAFLWLSFPSLMRGYQGNLHSYGSPCILQWYGTSLLGVGILAPSDAIDVCLHKHQSAL